MISLTVIARNAEETLARCLASAAWVDEKIVVDSGSTDRTLEIARAAGAKVYERAWEGYSSQKNYAIDQAKGDWIISLDSDEWLTEELSRELKERLTSSKTQAGWQAPMKTYYFGKWLQHGGFWPDYHLRVFRRMAGRSVAKEKEVHEGFHVEGSVGDLTHPIGHEAYPNLYGYIQKFNRYTTLEAEGWVRAERPLYGYDMLIRPMHRWIKRYGIQGGWRDGAEGLLACSLAAAYEWVVALKVYERRPVNGVKLLTTLFKR